MGLELALQNLVSPPVLAFSLGLLAMLLKSDLRLPDAVYQGLSIYLLLGIGIEGGVALSQSSFAEISLPLVGTLALGLIVPLLAYWILGVVTKIGAVDKGALAAHYGSTSLVTFTAALVLVETSGFLQSRAMSRPCWQFLRSQASLSDFYSPPGLWAEP